MRLLKRAKDLTCLQRGDILKIEDQRNDFKIMNAVVINVSKKRKIFGTKRMSIIVLADMKKYIISKFPPNDWRRIWYNKPDLVSYLFEVADMGGDEIYKVCLIEKIS